jgi:hypothetical protein
MTTFLGYSEQSLTKPGYNEQIFLPQHKNHGEKCI